MPHDIPVLRTRREMVRNRFFTAIEEDITSGTTPYTYNFIECHYNAVLIVPVLDDGRLIVENIYRHPYHRYFYEFPAGGIEPNEDPLAAAARELEEETGYQAAHLELMGACEPMTGMMTMRLSVVLATGLTLTGKIQHEALELLQVQVMDEDQAWRHAEEQPASSFLTHGLLYWHRHRTRPQKNKALG